MIEAFLKGSDVFVSLPTGSGKSLCYALLPAAFDSLRESGRSIVIVVNPLIALMKDQFQSLERRDSAASPVARSNRSSNLLAEERQIQRSDTPMRRLPLMPAYRDPSEGASCHESSVETGHRPHKQQAP